MSLLACCALLGVAVAQTGRFSAPLTFTGNAETDFAPGGVLKRGVVLLADATLGPNPSTTVTAPDVGVPPGPDWAGRLSGWDIKSIFFQFNFE
jgi:hypothetical protein